MDFLIWAAVGLIAGEAAYYSDPEYVYRALQPLVSFSADDPIAGMARLASHLVWSAGLGACFRGDGGLCVKMLSLLPPSL